ncbi:MAG: hypothetical protein ACRDJC_24470, partial [Thermomicrobiales bacterium]
GDVVENGQHLPLAQRVWQEMAGLVPFEVVECAEDAYDETAKTTRVWGEERKGRATPKDRVIVLRRVALRRRHAVHRHSGSAAQQKHAADGAARRR